MDPDYAAATYDDDGNPATPEVPWPEVFQRYAMGVRRIDDAVGDLKQLLQDLAIDTNTLVVFTSDNGPTTEDYLTLTPRYAANFFDTFGPMDGVKRDTWEGGIRMPTIVRWPGTIPAGAISNTPSQFQDWMPTFTELAGLPGPARSDGVSLVPTLTGHRDPAPQHDLCRVCRPLQHAGLSRIRARPPGTGPQPDAGHPPERLSGRALRYHQPNG